MAKERADIPDKYKWNLADLYATEAAWQDAKTKLASRLSDLSRYQGQLGSSASTLAEALETMSSFNKELNRLTTYSDLSADQDTRDAGHQGMRQETVLLRSALQSQAAFIEPEVLRIDAQTLEKFVAEEPRLRVHRFYLKEVRRLAAHTLSENEEKLLAGIGPVSNSAANAYSILKNADFPYPSITLSDGRSVKIDQAAYTDLRALPNREDRKKVMSSFFNSLSSFNRTFGATIDGQLQSVLFFARSRKYSSTLEMMLDGPNLPATVYSRLVDGVNRNLPSLHRYLKLRQRMLGVDALHYYDLYAPLTASVQAEYTPEEAQKHVLAALAPLGAEYTSTLERAFNERWIDMLPSEGKRSGAYSDGSPVDVHPYVLMNFNGKYTDVSTLAHELGHAMHSYFSNKTQPYPMAFYPLFVAEVASTFDEALLVDYMMKTTTNRDMRLALLGNYLENVKGTVFRTTQFAEFELGMHEMARQGQPIVGETLNNLYMDITKRYYGHNEGICIVDDYIAHEWSMVPHFYSAFYMFQYATSFTASEALAAKVKSGDAEATRRYLAFLSAGGSKYAIELLKDAGVDMTTDEPLDLTIQAMNRAMDEMERIIDSPSVT